MTNRSLRCSARTVATHAALVLGLAAALLAPLDAARASSDDPPPFIGLSGQFTLIEPLRPAPEIRFLDGSGAELSLARFRGKVVLLNFWATWCAPCIREMPTIDRLQVEFGGDAFTVVAISTDRKGAAIVTPFLKKLGLQNLDVYIDRRLSLYKALGVRGLPTTFLIDHEGRLRGYLEGPAEWDSREARALMRYYIERAERAAVKRATSDAKGGAGRKS